MQILGYIYSKRKLMNVPRFIGVVSDYEKIDNLNKPLLIVGLEEAKKKIENFSILEHKASDNLFWTFGKTEKRDIFEKDVETFYRYCINEFVGKIKYYYINILTLKYNKAKKLLEIINSSKGNYIYISNGMIYISYNNCTLGVSKEIMEYCGIKTQKVIDKLKHNSKNKILFNDSQLDSKFKSFFRNKEYVIPYFILNDNSNE